MSKTKKDSMLTVVVLAIIAFCWWKAEGNYRRTSELRYRRSRAGWAWAFVGAGAGSFLGIAGFGTAIAGTLPGAACGYFAADYLMIRRLHDKHMPPASTPPANSQDVALIFNAATGLVTRFVRWGLKMTVPTLVAVFVIYRLYEVSDSKQNREMPPVAEVVTSQLATTTSAHSSAAHEVTSALPAATALDIEVTRLEKQYPQIQPGSPLYDRQLVEGIKIKMAELQAAGISPELAARAATQQAVEASPMVEGTGSLIDRFLDSKR